MGDKWGGETVIVIKSRQDLNIHEVCVLREGAKGWTRLGAETSFGESMFDTEKAYRLL